MADFYQEYKPFRNFLQQFGLQESLVNVWRYSLLVMDKISIATEIHSRHPSGFDPRSVLHAWELGHSVPRARVERCTIGPRSLRNWNDLAKTVNHLRHLDGVAFMRQRRKA